MFVMGRREAVLSAAIEQIGHGATGVQATQQEVATKVSEV